MSGSRIQNTVITRHSSQHKMNVPSWSRSWTFWGHSNPGPGGCWKGRCLLCITSSVSTMTCSTIWMVLCEHQLGKRLNGRKSYTLLWGLRDRRYPYIVLKYLQRPVCFLVQHISLICSGSWRHLASGTCEQILFLRTRLHILPGTKRHCLSMCRNTTGPNKNEFPSLNPKADRGTISSPLQRLPDPANPPLIQMIHPALMKNT